MEEKQMFTIPLITCLMIGAWSEADPYEWACCVVQYLHPFGNKQHYFSVPKCWAQVVLKYLIIKKTRES